MTEAKMVKTIYIKAPRERVWAYLTEPEKLARWFHEADNPLASGQDYRLMRENYAEDEEGALCWGKVLEANAPSRLVYTFTHKFLQGVETKVEWELSEQSGGTQVIMTHTGWEASADPLDMMSNHDKGWDQHFARLRMVAS